MTACGQTSLPFAGRRITVMGLGRFGGGVGVTRFLARRGAVVTVSDQAPADQLAESVKALADLDVRLHLGGHLEADFTDTDLVVVNPAVPAESPFLSAARSAGVPLTCEIAIFLQACTAPVVGITGSVGKSTTTAMIGDLLASRFITHVGGNIGKSLLEDLDNIYPDHVVVLELSSFQLELSAPAGISPHVALVTNLSPNHLDRHGTMDAYSLAKMNVFRFQGPQDVLVLNRTCAATAHWADQAKGKVIYFDPADEPFELSVPGRHNQANAQAGWAVVRELGIDRSTAQRILSRFAGLPHRLEFVAQRNEVRYYNDSKCTTPEGAIVAAEAFEPGRLIMIVGGYDKHVSFEALARTLVQRAKAVVTIGATRNAIIQAIRACPHAGLSHLETAEDLQSAVSIAKEHSAAGDSIVLSPACASYDMFVNYEHRGGAFVDIVRRL